jgi:ABC-type polysaccharide/polyol phosphate transport system ATPase subunit
VSDVVVSVRDLSKRYKLYRDPWGRVVEWMTGGRAVRHESFWALAGITLDVRRGECLGIIGVNGAGKTTLLKILSRALYPTAGRFEVKGRLVSLLELGTGFHPELTGRENVFQSTRLLGFPEAYVRARLPEILDFAEIGEFIDQPVKRYSSGMFVRLAFALFAHLQPDVYIVDEALSVGDVFFQRRCVERFGELRRQGCTVLLVSHDMEAITRLCDRAILLNRGELAADGDVASVVRDYFALMGRSCASAPSIRPAAPGASGGGHLAGLSAEVRRELERPVLGRHADIGSRASEIVGFAVSDLEGRLSWTVRSGETLRFWVLLEARERIDDLDVAIQFHDRRGILIFAVCAADRDVRLPSLKPGEQLVCVISVALAIQSGEYTLLPQVGGRTGEIAGLGVLHDRLESLPPVVVARVGHEALPPFYGLVNLATDMEWTTDVPRSDSPRASGGAGGGRRRED